MPEPTSRPEATYYFPRDFAWGTATASHQVEGNNSNSDWLAAESAGELRFPSGNAANWLDLDQAFADLDMAAEMGNNAHRLSLEWSRLEPEPGVFSAEWFDYYRALLEGMRARGLAPMVTLHHFSNPIWFQERGDFVGPDSDIGLIFDRYATHAAEALGDLVAQWITINEPLVYFQLRHMAKVFPSPSGDRGLRPGLRGVRGMLVAHAAAYHALKRVTPQVPVGMSKSWLPFYPYRERNPLDIGWASALSHGFNGAWMGGLTRGRVSPLFGGGRISGLANSFDFVGLNYYNRRLAAFPSIKNPAKGDPEMFPEGITRAIVDHLAYNKPIYITENGVDDAADATRPSYLIRHLHQVWRNVNFNYPVMGYFHWTLIDNYEWDRGWTERFGLIEVDPETQVRTMRPSGRLYGAICREFAITPRMVDEYAPECRPHLYPS